MFQHPFLAVHDLASKAILGNDFLQKFGAWIDTASNKVFFPSKHLIDTNTVIASPAYNLKTTKNISIPSMSSLTIAASVVNSSGEKLACGSLGFTASNTFLVVEALQTVGFDSCVRLVIINSSHDKIDISKGSIVGWFSQTSNELVSPLDETLKLSIDAISANSNTPLSTEKREYLLDLLNTNSNALWRDKLVSEILNAHSVFSAGPLDLGRTSVIQHKIRLKSKEPVHKKQFRVPWEHQGFLDEYVDGLLNKGCITASRSPYNAPIFCVKKPHGHGLRVVQDFRALNDACYDDRYIIREVQQCIDEIGQRGSRIFSSLDLTSGFWQLSLHPDSRPMTAFTVPGRGRFEWVTTPMGLHGSPSSFARMMDHIMAGIPGVITYMDDILVHSPNMETHIEDLKCCFKRLAKYSLKLNIAKCVFATSEVPYLGFKLTQDGVIPGDEKTKVVENFPTPDSKTKIKSFCGLSNYFRQMIPNYQRLSSPLTILTRQDNKYDKGEIPPEAKEAFETLKRKLCSKPILAYPRKGRKFILMTDAATGDKQNPGGLGAVLLQKDSFGKEYVISYASRGLKLHEENYSPFLLEMAAACWAIEYFHVYLFGTQFELHTDHKPLETLSTIHKKTLNRLQALMLDYNFTTHYRPGVLNGPADALSRSQIQVNLIDALKSLTYLQKSDPFCVATRLYLDTGILPDDRSKARSIASLSRFMFVENDILKMNLSLKGTAPLTVAVLPSISQNEVIKAAHDGPFGGHGGVAQTLAKIRKEFWWLGQATAVSNFVRNCNTCQKVKNLPNYKQNKTTLQPLDSPSGPNLRVHMDLFGPLRSNTPNKYILVMTDAFTKYAELAAIPNKQSDTVAKAILDKWICRFSLPDVILTDNGGEFANEISKELFKLLELKHYKTSPYHPQTNACAETFNKVIISYCRSMLHSNTLEWEECLPALSLAYNSRNHSATAFTPFFLTFGREAKLPGLYFSNTPIYGQSYASMLTKQLKETYVQVQSHLDKEKSRMLSYAKNHNKTSALREGDPVYVYQEQKELSGNKKLQPLWEDKYVVQQKLGPTTFMVRRPHGHIKMRHADKLKLAKGIPRIIPQQKHPVRAAPKSTSPKRVRFSTPFRQSSQYNLYDSETVSPNSPIADEQAPPPSTPPGRQSPLIARHRSLSAPPFSSLSSQTKQDADEDTHQPSPTSPVQPARTSRAMQAFRQLAHHTYTLRSKGSVSPQPFPSREPGRKPYTRRDPT